MLATLFCALGFGQESVRLVPRRVMLVATVSQESGFAPGDALMIVRSLHQRLQEADRDVIFVEPEMDAPAATQEDLAALAGRTGADSWLQVSLQGDWTSARLHVRAFDLLLRTSVADLAMSRTSWGSAGGLSQETWTEITQAIAGKYPMLESSAPASAAPQLARLIIRALPGSLVTGLGSPPLRIGKDGTAFRMLPPLKEYSFRTDLVGYVPVSTRIYLSADREVDLRQVKSSTWGLEASLADSRAPGADISVYFPASSLFARTGFSTYALGLALDSRGILLDMPLTNLSLQFGTYLSPEDRLFRFYVAVGGFVRMVHAPDTRPLLDRLAPAGIRLAVGTEVPVSDRGKLYLELTPTFYPTSSPDALRAALGQDNGAPGWAFGPGEALNILSFRVGYRWRPG